MRELELRKEGLTLREDAIMGFFERTVTPFGNSAKADVPKRFIGHRVYVIVTNVKVQK